MKTTILSIFFLAGLTVAVHAQQSATTILKADGTQELRFTDAAGKITVITPAKGESAQQAYANFFAKQPKEQAVPNAAATAATNNVQYVHHEAVLGKSGASEIHLTDASGKVTIIAGDKGQTAQAKYLELIKQGMPCGCSSAASSTQSVETKTATLPGTQKN
jgi:hypothetical protein